MSAVTCWSHRVNDVCYPPTPPTHTQEVVFGFRNGLSVLFTFVFVIIVVLRSHQGYVAWAGFGHPLDKELA